eukprot:CAMPEP_0113937670 /NCGR_PEP_ID=MMETSP1339-20121228/4235_1 /TAXON_ID=94617 /ORGANISM="Fibrocapsa japonica" /LENGTH=443 /DNA_ID=CAMNT_0000940519 /DNA_START=161 /DNA_END=1492 /DNA_ORIENTATION=+ /assembly_acc=CAM_ASM_000762
MSSFETGSPERIWFSVVDPSSGRTYYFDSVTKETSWAYPENAIVQDYSSVGAGQTVELPTFDFGTSVELPTYDVGTSYVRESSTFTTSSEAEASSLTTSSVEEASLPTTSYAGYAPSFTTSYVGDLSYSGDAYFTGDASVHTTSYVGDTYSSYVGDQYVRYPSECIDYSTPVVPVVKHLLRIKSGVSAPLSHEQQIAWKMTITKRLSNMMIPYRVGFTPEGEVLVAFEDMSSREIATHNFSDLLENHVLQFNLFDYDERTRDEWILLIAKKLPWSRYQARVAFTSGGQVLVALSDELTRDEALKVLSEFNPKPYGQTYELPSVDFSKPTEPQNVLAQFFDDQFLSFQYPEGDAYELAIPTFVAAYTEEEPVIEEEEEEEEEEEPEPVVVKGTGSGFGTWIAEESDEDPVETAEEPEEPATETEDEKPVNKGLFSKIRALLKRS